jgi:hypothetical protein
MTLEIIPLAQRDIAEAARYYGSQRPGLDDEFLAEIDASAQKIMGNPYLFEEIHPGIRRCLVHRFPLRHLFPNAGCEYDSHHRCAASPPAARFRHAAEMSRSYVGNAGHVRCDRWAIRHTAF